MSLVIFTLRAIRFQKSDYFSIWAEAIKGGFLDAFLEQVSWLDKPILAGI